MRTALTISRRDGHDFDRAWVGAVNYALTDLVRPGIREWHYAFHETRPALKAASERTEAPAAAQTMSKLEALV